MGTMGRLILCPVIAGITRTDPSDPYCAERNQARGKVIISRPEKSKHPWRHDGELPNPVFVWLYLPTKTCHPLPVFLDLPSLRLVQPKFIPPVHRLQITSAHHV